MYTGLHPKQYGHQVVGSSITLLHADETPPGTCSSGVPSRGITWPIEAGSEKGQKSDQKDETLLLGGKAWRIVVVHHGDEVSYRV